VDPSVLEQYVVWPDFDDFEVGQDLQDVLWRRLLFVQLVV
jgi:hypothetical protein